MKKRRLVLDEILFETTDVFSKKIRSTKQYWKKITEEKHRDLTFAVHDIIRTIEKPNEVYRSVKDETVFLQYKRHGAVTVIAVTKHLNGDGFLVTAYQTTKVKRKGDSVWPK